MIETNVTLFASELMDSGLVEMNCSGYLKLSNGTLTPVSVKMNVPMGHELVSRIGDKFVLTVDRKEKS